MSVEFTATQWATVEDKVKFAKQFQKFVEGGFQSKHFPKWFYVCLSNCFGMIAHYDQAGFYGEYFATPRDKARFVQECLWYSCYGDPAWTFSDVEKFLQHWLRHYHWLEKTVAVANDSLEKAERAELARLKAKYNDEKWFDLALKSISTHGRLDPQKIKLLDGAVKQQLVFHIVKYRQPVVADLIPETLDWGNGRSEPFANWLAAMGYLYKTKGQLFTFVHTSEQRIA